MKIYSKPELTFRSFEMENIVTASADANGDSIQMVLDNIAPEGSGVSGRVVVQSIDQLEKLF